MIMSFIHKMILFLAYIQKPEWMLESFNLKTKNGFCSLFDPSTELNQHYFEDSEMLPKFIFAPG